MMELTELQKKEISLAIEEMDRIQRITAFDNLKKARLWSGLGIAAGLTGVLMLWSGTGLNAAAAGNLASLTFQVLLVASIFLAWFTHQKLSVYSAAMKQAEKPLVEIGLKYKPPGSGVESDAEGRCVPNTKGYIVNKTTNTYLDITDLVCD